MSVHAPFEFRNLGQRICASGMSATQFAEGYAASIGKTDARTLKNLRRTCLFAQEFVSSGATTYVLSHSIAAALSATRAPRQSFGGCPFSAYLIEVPSEYLPLPGALPEPFRSAPKRWIAVLATPAMCAVAVHATGIASTLDVTFDLARTFDEETCQDMMSFDFLHEGAVSKLPADNRAVPYSLEAKIAFRLVANVTAFVVTYRESVKERQGRKGVPLDQRTLDVDCPLEVHVDRVFRDHVRSLVKARTFPRARGVLEHFVRGHWRHSGEGLLWIAPYRRGDPNIGSVISVNSRIEASRRLEAGAAPAGLPEAVGTTEPGT